MKVKFVYKILPALVIYTDRIKTGFAGTTIGPLVLIRPGRRADMGLLAHELTHVKQSYCGLMIFNGLLYWLDDQYRKMSEIEAYREQLRYSTSYEADVMRFTGYICTKYRLEVDPWFVDLLLRNKD